MLWNTNNNNNRKSHRWLTIFALVAAVATVFTKTANAQTTPTMNNAGTLNNDGRLSKFVEMLDRVGLSPSVGTTIFAPTTGAIQNFRAQDVNLWNKYASQGEFYVHLRELLLWHLVTEDKYTFAQIFNGGRQFLENSKGNITVNQQFQKLDNVPATAFAETNIETTDGIVHILDQVIIPPFLSQNLMDQLLDDQSAKFAMTTMANLALFVGLDDEIDKMYEHGITILVPPNRRFNRAEINVPKLLTEEMREYTRDFVLCHMIKDIYYKAGVFAFNEENDQEQMLVTSELGTNLWITTTGGDIRFQSTPLLVSDQAARNGLFHVLDMPLYPPFISDFAFFTHKSTNQDTSDCFRFFTAAKITSEQIAAIFDTDLTMFCPTRQAYEFFNNEDFNRLLEPIWIRHATEFLLNHMSAGARSRNDLVNAAPSTITMLSGQTYELRRSGTRPRIKHTSKEQARSEFGDLIALDGYLHMTDTTLTPTAVSRSVYDQCQDNPDFSLLVTNIAIVDMTNIIDSDSPLTLLAPDNRAWRRISFGVLAGGEILKRHLFRGLLFCDVIANATQLSAVNGITLGVELRGENNEHLWVGGAYVYECDILARNGVLHYVDRVIGEDYDTVAPTMSPAPTITAQPTAYVPPTISPIPRPTGSIPIYLPPNAQQPTPPPINQVNNQGSSSAIKLSFTLTGVFVGVACYFLSALY